MEESNLNQFSKEIQVDIDTMTEKYGITKGILLFEEKDINDDKKRNHRAIVFGRSKEEDKDFLHNFANLVLQCIDSSRTFSEIMTHAGKHTLKEMIAEIQLPLRGKRAD